VAREAFRKEVAEGRVVILTKPNSGKADALNFGLEHIGDAEIFVALTPTPSSPPMRSRAWWPHFLNPKSAPWQETAKVGNRVNLWTRWQALEYITSQNFERRALTPWAR